MTTRFIEESESTQLLSTVIITFTPDLLCSAGIALSSICLYAGMCVCPHQDWKLLITDWCNWVLMCVMMNPRSDQMLMTLTVIFEIENSLSILTRHCFVRDVIVTSQLMKFSNWLSAKFTTTVCSAAVSFDSLTWRLVAHAISGVTSEGQGVGCHRWHHPGGLHPNVGL